MLFQNRLLLTHSIVTNCAKFNGKLFRASPPHKFKSYCIVDIAKFEKFENGCGCACIGHYQTVSLLCIKLCSRAVFAIFAFSDV